jgi:hypothetical protein
MTAETTWSLVNSTRIIDFYEKHMNVEWIYLFTGDEKGDVWNMAEADVTISNGWYWHKNAKPKTTSKLTDMYFNSVGLGGQFLLNLPPNTSGLIPENIVTRAALFGTELEKSFENDITQHGGVTAKVSSARGGSWEYDGSAVLTPDVERYWSMDDNQTTGWVEIDLGREYTFDVISISEHIPLGQRVKQFSCEIYTNGVWRMFMRGTTIGAKRLLRWLPVTASRVRINITESLAVPCIEKVGIFKVYGHFGLEGRPPKGLWIVPYGEFQIAQGSWVEDEECLLGTGESGTLQMKRNFGRFWVMGNKDPSYGTMQIWVEGKHVADVDTSSSTHEREQILYVSEPTDVSQKQVQIKYSGKPIAINAVYFREICGPTWGACYPLHAEGMFELESKSYSVKRGEELKVKVRRVTGSYGNSSVFLTTVPVTAVPGVDFDHVSTDLTFDQGEVEKDVIIRVHSSGSGSHFSVELMGPIGGGLVGDNWTSLVSIVGNGLGESKVEVKTFALGTVILCGVAGLLIAVLVIVKKRKNDDHLIKDNGSLSYTET